MVQPTLDFSSLHMILHSSMANEARYNSDVVTFLVPLLKSSGLKVH